MASATAPETMAQPHRNRPRDPNQLGKLGLGHRKKSHCRPRPPPSWADRAVRQGAKNFTKKQRVAIAKKAWREDA